MPAPRATAGVPAFALRSLARDMRSGELRVLVAALVIAVAGISAVGFFTDRIHQAILAQASELLAADLVVASPYPIDRSLDSAARARGLHTTRTLSFRSTVVHGDHFQLVEIKAVAPGYPLRGALRVAPAPFAPDHAVHGIPSPGTVWLDPRLMSILGLALGDGIRLGSAEFRIARVLSFEPDRGGDLFSIAPRVLMNLQDVPRTGLVQAGSRVRHRLLVAGAANAIAAFHTWLAAHVDADQRIEGVRDAGPELRSALDRARRFLGLAALASVLLAGAAIAIAAQRYVLRRQDAAAVMRCLGASQNTVLGLYATQLLVVGAAASAAGCLLGYGAQGILAALVGDLTPIALPPPSGTPFLLGMATGLVTLAGFALPPLLRLRHVPPARVLRRDLGVAPPSAWAVYGLAAVTLIALVWWQAADARLAGYVLGGAAGTLVLLGAGSLVLIRLLATLRGRVGVAWRFGLANIARRARASTVQVVAFGLGIMLLLLLTVVRTSLLDEWQRNLPPDTPNYFLINIQPAEVAPLKAFLHANGLPAASLYPMVRGRLVAVNGKPVQPGNYTEPRARHLSQHEFNLSWARDLRSDNRVTRGRWWDAAPPYPDAFSVEQGLADTLHIALGDRLTFSIAGEDVSGRVASLRAVDWDSFKANFFVVAPPGLLGGYPATWITSFHLPEKRVPLLSELVRRFPSVTVVDVDALLTNVRAIMDRAVTGVEYVFVFSLLAGLTVLLAAIQSTLDERRFETAVVRTLGARRGRLLAGLAAEFTTLGLLAGLLAAAAATAVGAVLARHVFQLAWHPDPWVWVFGIAGGAVGVGLAGVLGTRGVLDTPPAETLRRL